MMKLLTLLCVACAIASAAQTRTVYMKPKTDSPCVEDQECYIFSQVLQDPPLAETIFSSDTLLVFLSGDHVLDFEAEAFYTISNLQNMALLGSPNRTLSDSITRPTSRIVCISPFAMAFINISGLSITNLTLSNCGANITTELAAEAFSVQTNGIHSFGPEQKAAILLINVQPFLMAFSVVERSLGYGLLGINVLGDSVILGTIFFSNNNYTASVPRCTRPPNSIPDDITACSGGNALFVFEDLLKCPSTQTYYSLIIQNSYFIKSVNRFGGLLPDKYLTRGAGLGIVLAQSSYGVLVSIFTVEFDSNTALIGANIYAVMYDRVDNSTIIMQEMISEYANFEQQHLEERHTSSGGLHMDYNLPVSGTSGTAPVCSAMRKYREEILRITYCSFNDNLAILGAGAYIQIRTSDFDGHVAMFSIQGCAFTGNVGTSGTAMYINQEKSFRGRGSSQVMIHDINVINNRYIEPIRNLVTLFTNFELNAIQLIGTESVSFADCNFFGTEGTALSGFEAEILMSGSIVFTNNSGILGGGINLQNSYLVFTPHTMVTFTNNYALRHGGAINVIGRPDVVSPCFFQVSDLSFLPDPNVTVYFEGNYAKEAGSVLYGGSVDRCIVSTQSSLFLNTSSEVFDHLVTIGPHSNASSLIASDSTTVCLCRYDSPECEKRELGISLFAGASISIPVVTIGQRGGITPSTVIARIVQTLNDTASLSKTLQPADVGKTCTDLNITVLGGLGTMDSTIVIQTGNLAVNGSVMVHFSIEPCPLGFVVDNNTDRCACDPVAQLDYINICDLNTQMFHRDGGSWISPSFAGPNRTYEGLLVFLNCPYDYCLPMATNLSLSDPDSQCAFNHTGVLCGACKSGLSRALSTSNCVECSNYYLFLLIVYAAAGFGLVVLLFVLDLTITNGTINGVIFYANIVYINYGIFIPALTTQDHIVLVIISWLNLDAGLQLCLYDGMDGYAKVWLDYAFPFYVWLIMLAIIMASRFSSRLTRLAGSKSVPVLATLLLLSYTKLVRVVIISLSSALLTNPDGSITAVWSYDSNVELWVGKHVALGLFSVVVIVFFIIPYTVVLLFVPLSCVQARSTHRLLSWISRLKPFNDAYEGPFKKNFRNWTGILLLVRILLSILNAVKTSSGRSDEVILLINTIIMFLLVGFGWVSGGGMYQKWQLNILECSFFFNIGILSIATLYARLTGADGGTVILVSGWIILVQLGGIMLYHCWKRILLLKQVKKGLVGQLKSIFDRLKKDQDKSTSAPSVPSIAIKYPVPSVTSVNLSELREPLIED